MPRLTLPGPAQLELRGALLASFAQERLIELLLALDKNYAAITAGGASYRTNALTVVQEAQADGWLVDLVRAAHKEVPGEPVFEQILRRFAAHELPEGTSHFEVCRLTGSHVMIDRATLRAGLQRLDEPLGKRILVVNSERRKRGKSHSMHLISYLHETQRGFWLVPLDLEAFKRFHGDNVVVDPRQVARMLVTKLQYRLTLDPPPEDGAWARWVQEFCDDLEAHAISDERRPWVVIDGFNNVQLAQAALDLVKELALRVSVTLTGFRLVLLGYREPFPNDDVLKHVEREEIAEIGAREMLEFFRCAYAQMRLPLARDALVEAAARVLDGLNAADEDFLVTLGTRASEELDRARAGAGS
jgi:Effector-associated domain 1